MNWEIQEHKDKEVQEEGVLNKKKKQPHFLVMVSRILVSLEPQSKKHIVNAKKQG